MDVTITNKKNSSTQIMRRNPSRDESGTRSNPVRRCQIELRQEEDTVFGWIHFVESLVQLTVREHARWSATIDGGLELEGPVH